MNTKKKNIIFVLTLALIMIVSTTANTFATASGQDNGCDFQEELLEYGFLPGDTYIEDPSDSAIMPYSTNKILIMANFTRQSRGKALAHVNASRAGASRMKSTITLQISKGNSYVNTGAKSVIQTKKGQSIAPTATFSVAPGKKYRVKIKITATVGGSTQSSYAYRKLI